ncbi:hypothetical protein [Sphingomonas sp. IW22]|uniref:hypothetical protein n=1 Tax=Sphingomonas sp. IW22 TaxID=3242489 RepID=UPI003522DC17
MDRVALNLRRRAVLVLLEAAQTARYRRYVRTRSVAFALAYLRVTCNVDRERLQRFWDALEDDSASRQPKVWQAAASIAQLVGEPFSEELADKLWHECQVRYDAEGRRR